MKQIRHGVFETNSSSTHAICIAKNNLSNPLPKELYFDFDEYGWEWDLLSLPDEKASYLHTGIYAYYSCYHEKIKDAIQFIRDTLAEYDIRAYFKNPKYITYKNGNQTNSYFDSGYVDHSEELSEFLEDVLSDKQMLMNYLFGDHSFVQTGNDNSDEQVDITVDYDHDAYYKLN